MLVGLVRVGYSTDPAKCQRLIKYMLINACGVTKREHSQPRFVVMDNDEIDQYYRNMIDAGVIKGLDNRISNNNGFGETMPLPQL